jgi:uncharacterized membrane protein YraQ (UPF0718 family)
MNGKGRNSSMVVATIILGCLATALLFFGYFRGEGGHITGMKWALSITVTILPLLVFAFIVAGMIQVLLPKEVVARWVGGESGMRGIVIGTVAGGPYVSLPIVAGLLHSGAGIGTMVAFLTGWSLWAFARLPMEVGILGWKFTIIRLACTFFFPPIAGLVAQTVFSGTKWL